MVFPLLIGGAITLGLGYLARGSISEWMKTRQTENQTESPVDHLLPQNYLVNSMPQHNSDSYRKMIEQERDVYLNGFPFTD